jgi:hypothetical protein
MSPFVIRRASRATSLDGKQLHRQTQIEVVAVEMPQKVLAETRTAAYVRTIEKYPQGSTVTMEMVCSDVPGGIVAHASREQDDAGRLVRRSTLELVDHGVAGPEKSTARIGLFRHRTVRRSPAIREP